MPEYRAGGSWGRTLILVGTGPADEKGRRPDDFLIGSHDSAMPANFTARAAELLTAAERACTCDHAGLEMMFHLHPCPVAVFRDAARRR